MDNKAQHNGIGNRRFVLPDSDLMYILVIAITFSLVFTIWGAWLDGQFFTDEPAYVDLAIRSWQAGKGTPVAFSPLYHDLITPFVAIFFEKEMGFKIWKYLLFLITSVLVYYNVKRLANKWVGLIAAVHFQLLSIPYICGTLSTLAITWLLMCSLLLLSGRRVLGLVAGLLLLGIHIRGEFLIISVVFIALCLALSPKEIFQKRFFLQLAVPLAIFVGLIYLHGSDVREYKKMYTLRGAFGYQHYIINTMLEFGYFKKYTTETNRGLLKWEDLDKVFVEHFGKSLTTLRSEGKFDLPDLYRANPELIKAHYRRIFAESRSTIPAAFVVNFPNSSPMNLRTLAGSLPAYWASQVGVYLLFAGLALLPAFLLLARRRPYLMDRHPPPRRFYAILFAPLAGFVPWYLTMPQEHYVIMASSVLYLGGGIVFGIILTRLADFSQSLAISDKLS